MKRSMSSVVVAVLLVMAVAATAQPMAALSLDDDPPVSPPPSTASPLLDALTYEPLKRDSWDISFDFTDWSALKAAHGGEDISSASPLQDRQRLMLDIARSEWSTEPLGLDRLAIWPERWGWDNTDLAWQATLASGRVHVLRFREDWDPSLFIARLGEYGYSRSDKPHGIAFTAGPDADVPLDARLERVLGWERSFQDQPPVMPASVATSLDGRTLVMTRFGEAHKVLKWAARADPDVVADSPFGRVATALGRPISATIIDGRYGCPGTDEEVDYLPAEAAALVRSVDPLHPYQALGIGYERAGPGEPAVGRYVFAYGKAKHAKADLPGRRTLIDEGYSIRHGEPYRDAAFTLVDAAVDGRELVLDVALVNDTPRILIDLLVGRSMSFATCS